MVRNERRTRLLDDDKHQRIKNEVSSLTRQINHLRRCLPITTRQEKGFILACIRDLLSRKSRLGRKLVAHIEQEVANLQQALEMAEEKERIQELLRQKQEAESTK
jgi:hypothetical protein